MSWNNLAWACSLISEYKTAIDYARKAVNLQPQNSAAWDTLGYAQCRAGAYENEALGSMNNAIKIAPNIGVYYYHRAQIYERLDKQDLVKADYQKAKELKYTPGQYRSED